MAIHSKQTHIHTNIDTASHRGRNANHIKALQSVIARYTSTTNDFGNDQQSSRAEAVNRPLKASKVHIDCKWGKTLIEIVGSTEGALILSECVMYYNNEYRSFTIHDQAMYGLLTSYAEIQRDYKVSYSRAKILIQSLIDQDLFIAHTQGFIHNQRFYTPTVKALEIINYLHDLSQKTANPDNQSNEAPLAKCKGTSPYKQKTYKDKYKDKKNNNQDRLYLEDSADQNLNTSMTVIFDFSQWGLGKFMCEAEIAGVYTARQLQVIGLITLHSQTEIDCHKFIAAINDIDNRQQSTNFKALTRLAYHHARIKTPAQQAVSTASIKPQAPVDCYSDAVSGNDCSMTVAQSGNDRLIERYPATDRNTDKLALIEPSPLPAQPALPFCRENDCQADGNRHDLLHQLGFKAANLSVLADKKFNEAQAESMSANVTDSRMPSSFHDLPVQKQSRGNFLASISKVATKTASNALVIATGTKPPKTQFSQRETSQNKTFADYLSKYRNHPKSHDKIKPNIEAANKNAEILRQHNLPDKTAISSAFSGLQDITAADIKAMIKARAVSGNDFDNRNAPVIKPVSNPTTQATGIQGLEPPTQAISPNKLPLTAYQQSLLMTGLSAAGVDSEILIRTAACEVLTNHPDIEIKALVRLVVDKLVGQPTKKSPQVVTELVTKTKEIAASPPQKTKAPTTKTFDRQRLPAMQDIDMPIVEKEVLRKNWTSLADQSFHRGVLPECQKIALVAVIDYAKRQGVVIGSDKEVYQWLYHMASNQDHYYSQAINFKHWCNIAINQLKQRRLECPKGFRNWLKRIDEEVGNDELIKNLYGRRLC